ncbi:hypothetical protein B7P43_G00427 [Cryptotermes secundus]|uniref:Uncharacterized protein n=1 Tax=Cryptotermes secundus TaxID=105785 RepID=A0A2J7R8X8_9NEOP|nr:hypothetical protein B7P43_G00427 [Cryptotermes secundus]
MATNQAGMQAMQQRVDANLKEIKDGTNANQAKADTILKEIKSSQEHLKEELTKMDSQLEKMKAINMVTDPGEMKSVVVHEEDPEEKVAMETSGALKK